MERLGIGGRGVSLAIDLVITCQADVALSATRWIGITSILGTVQHECSLTPSLSASYSSIMRERLRRAAEPKRKLQMLDVDRATANRLASGAGAAGVKGRVATFNVSWIRLGCALPPSGR